MMKKTSYEICFETLIEYSDGSYDIDYLTHWDFKNKAEVDQSIKYLKTLDKPFMVCVNKWTIADHDGWSEPIYLISDGTFDDYLPKNILLKLQPIVDAVMNNRLFRIY